METKPKKCKGSGKAIGHGCGDLVKYRKYGLGMFCCYTDWLLNTDEGKQIIHKNTISGKKVIDKKQKVENKKAKIENKSIAVLKLEAKQPFQKLIRIRDHRKKCICCDEMLPFNIGEYDAGHYFKSEIYSGLIFHPNNVHGQRVYCNQHLHGNEAGYNNGLVIRIGWDEYNKLNSIKDSLKSFKWDRYKLIEMKEHYQSELRLVEKGEKDIMDVDFSIGIINT